MATCWTQEKLDGSTQAEREAGRNRRLQPETLGTAPDPQIDHSLANRVEAEPHIAAGYAPGRAWLIGWGITVAAMVGIVILFFLDAVSLGVLASVATVAGIVAAVGLGHHLLWGRVFARGLVRERQRFQDRARRLETSATDPPDELSLGINDRE
jgi:hypothetical protein